MCHKVTCNGIGGITREHFFTGLQAKFSKAGRSMRMYVNVKSTTNAGVKSTGMPELQE